MDSRESAVWYCVLGVVDFRLAYLGDDKKAATAANIPGTHLATGATRGAAHRNAAIAAGFLKRSQPVPELGPLEEDAE